jgi:hypothetical protein
MTTTTGTTHTRSPAGHRATAHVLLRDDLGRLTADHRPLLRRAGTARTERELP